MRIARRSRRTLDIWPGFVDALATLLMVITFVLLIFIVAQYFLTTALSGSQGALAALQQKVASLTDQLAMVQRAEQGLKDTYAGQIDTSKTLKNQLDQLTSDLNARTAERNTLESQMSDLKLKLSNATSISDKAKQDAVTATSAQTKEISDLKTQLAKITAELDASQKSDADEKAQIDTLNAKLASETSASDKAKQDAATAASAQTKEIDDLKTQLAKIAAALDASQKSDTDEKTQIDTLNVKLNAALADKVEEMKKYRSEFFGKLREVLGNRPGIRIEGDRFVFQSELLFASGSAEMGPEGVKQINDLASTLKEIEQSIPKDINWVLRVDGHTDKRPITGKYASNWELSTERAINVVRALIADGIPADHLAAAGFGEFQPIDKADNEGAYAKNRRIELRLDQL